MNLFKTICLTAAIAAGTCACESDDESSFDPDRLVGTWIQTHKDGQAVPTDDRFVTTYRSDGTEMYAIRGKANHWVETDNYTYAFDGGILTIASGSTLLEYTAQKLTDSTLVYKVTKLIVGGTDLEDASVYTLRKATADYSSRFLGLWEGHETTDGLRGDTHRWRYNPDGTYQYYHAQIGGAWKNKEDNSGRYFLYGDFFVSNYRNDANTGVAGNACEGWEISMEGDTMRWKALRNGKTVSFAMSRVAQ